MSLAPLHDAAAAIEADLLAMYPALIATAGAVHDHVSNRLDNWEAATASCLEEQFPMRSHEQTLLQWQSTIQLGHLDEGTFGQAVDAHVDFCRAARQPANEAFWRRQSSDDERVTGTRLLLETWRRQMDQTRAAWEMQEIAKRRAVLLHDLAKLLQMLQALYERLAMLGLETGILLDLSEGSLTPQDIDQLERWFTYLGEDDGMKALCDMLGKMRQIAWSECIEQVRSIAPVITAMPDINSREEIVGIRLGRDIERLLPSELALLADPDTALLFDLKYAESMLMCFDMQRMQGAMTQHETDTLAHVSTADRQGPMIICIDTSGSMNGIPETIAKAIALYFATKAREQRRRCYLINFSTKIVTLDLSGNIGLGEVLRFLQMSFHGGTDVAPAMEHALDQMEQDAYEHADLLIVSDFIMSTLPGDTLSRIERQRLNGNKFHSLVVGECYMTQQLDTLFDNEWIVEPRTGRIHELVNFERRVRQTSSAHP